MKYSSPCFGWPSVGINKLVSICQTPGWISFDMLIDLNDGILTGFPFSHGSPEFCFSTDKVTDNVALQGKFSSFFFFFAGCLKRILLAGSKFCVISRIPPRGHFTPPPPLTDHRKKDPNTFRSYLELLWRVSCACNHVHFSLEPCQCSTTFSSPSSSSCSCDKNTTDTDVSIDSYASDGSCIFIRHLKLRLQDALVPWIYAWASSFQRWIQHPQHIYLYACLSYFCIPNANSSQNVCYWWKAKIADSQVTFGKMY